MTETACLFCKIVSGVIPCHRILETAHTLVFLDIGPLSRGHTLVIPKRHAAQLHELDDTSLADLLPTAARVTRVWHAKEGTGQYNVLQNNGRLAHQEVDHVHFHLIPKPNESQGLGVHWPAMKADHGELAVLAKELQTRLEA